MNAAIPRAIWTGAIAAVAIILLLGVLGQVADAQGLPGQAGLTAADPPPNARLADAPDRIQLTFEVPIDPASVSIDLLLGGGIDAPLAQAVVAPGNTRQAIAHVERPLRRGDYIVTWSARAAESGALLAGAYPFQSGIIENPGSALRPGEPPDAWAVLLRWLVFIGTALAAGGFGWTGLLATGTRTRSPGTVPRGALMTGGAITALAATLLSSVIGSSRAAPGIGTSSLGDRLQELPLGWWLQAGSLLILTMLCFIAVSHSGGMLSTPRMPGGWGLGIGLLALVGLSFTSHAATPPARPLLAVEIIHQWSAALWISGLVYLLGSWRSLGTDVAHFRRVRWIGGLVFGITIVTGAMVAWGTVPAAGALLFTRYGHVLSGKSILAALILLLGLFGMVLPRRSDAHRASGSLGAQAGLASAAAMLAAILALMVPPGMVTSRTLAGIELVDVARLDAEAFGAEAGVVRLLTQPGRAGSQTVVVRLEDVDGSPLAPPPSSEVRIGWTQLDGSDGTGVSTVLTPDSSGALYSGASVLDGDSWWRADVDITPPGGIAGRARFRFVLPDPNMNGSGPAPESDAAARPLFARGLDSLISRSSVRISQSVNDGSGSFYRVRADVSAAASDRPARYAATTFDAAGDVTSEERIIGDDRWLWLHGEGWVNAPSLPAPVPATLGAAYADATGFQFGPREEVDGELCQIVVFWRPPDAGSTREAVWFAWWVGLASGEVRQEALVSTKQYTLTQFTRFDAPVIVEPPIAPRDPEPAATPLTSSATPVATPIR